MKLIILYPTTFTNRDYQRFGIEQMKQKGYWVEIWELCKLFYGLERTQDTDVFNNQLIIDNIEQFKNKLSEDSECVFWDFTDFGEKGLEIKELLANTSSKYFWYYGGAVPNKQMKETIGSILREIYKQCHNKGILYYLKFIWQRFRNRMVSAGKQNNNDNEKKELERSNTIFKNMPNYIFLGSEMNRKYIPRELQYKTKEIFIHALDYDLFLKQQNEPENKIIDSIEGDYVVFLDTAYANHPDYILRGESSPIKGNEDLYYSQMQNLFKQIEEEYGVIVIIAGHPKVNYVGNEFGDRQILFFKTVELVSRAKFVICHITTSINYAVLYNKPILLVYNRQIKLSYEWKCGYKPLFIELNLHPYDLSLKSNHLDKYICIDADSYKSYIQKYIKRAGTKEDYSWNIIIEYLELL